MAPLQHGLNIQKKGPPGMTQPLQSKKPSIFDDDFDDEEVAETAQPDNGTESITVFDADAPSKSRPSTSAKPTNSSSALPKPPSKPLSGSANSHAQDLSTLRMHKKVQEEAEAVDASIYDYDAAYDALHAKSAAKKAADKLDVDRKAKYMENLLASAELRKRDQVHADDRKRQREREAEGEDFKDTEQFVTEAYKKQQEELRKMEEQEKVREEKEAEKRKKAGMGGFYRKIMDEEAERHAEAVEAAKDVNTSAPGQEQKVEESEETDAAKAARELNSKGAKIAINDEGQVTDKRQLLNAGLNVAPKRKADGSTSTSSRVAQQPVDRQNFRNRAANDSRKAMSERHTRMIEAQMEEAAKKEAEKEAEEREKMERAVKTRKTDGDISSARERYLQRKKEAAAAAAAGEQ